MSLDHLAVFSAVAEAGSFTGAGARLGVDKAHVSRVVRALEAALGVVLLHRSTRRVTLSPAGAELLARIAAPLAELSAATRKLTDAPAAPAGLVTLTTTPDLARALVAPRLAAFRRRFPAVRVRLALGPELASFDDGTIDLALRVGPARGARLVVRKLGELTAGFFAAPRYVAERGAPRSLGDFGRHDGLWPASARKRSFAAAGAPPPPAIDCDDFATLLELARAGAGIAVLPLHLAAREVAEGALVRVVPAVELAGAPLYVVTRPERPLPPRVAALRDFLAREVPAALSGRG